MRWYRAAGYKAREREKPWYYHGTSHEFPGRNYGGSSWKEIVKRFLGL